MAKETKPIWRPTKKDPNVVDKLEEIFRIDWTVGEACSQAGICRDTYYLREKNDKEFSDRMAKAKDYPFIVARKTLFKAATEWDSRSAIEILKRRDKRYSDKQDLTSWWEKVSFSVVNYSSDKQNDTI